MKRCWIHIGMHKTGTTSLQRTLSAAPHPADWHYVKLGHYVNLGVPFFAMFSPDPTSYHWFKKRGQTHGDAVARGKRYKIELKRIIESSTAEQFILSGEGIALLCREGVDNMRKYLAPMFDDIMIVAYVRPPIGFRTSMFQQRIKNGCSDFEVFRTPLVYRERFENVDEVFGRDKVHLWKFEPKDFPNGCVVTDFCRRVGIQLDPGASVVRTNESLTREGLGMLYAYRKFGDAYGTGATVIKENRSIIHALFAVKGEKFKLAPSLFSEVTPDDAESIAWMEARLGASLAETLDPAQSGIASEAELLTISRGACLSFVAEFEKLHGVTVLTKYIPGKDPAEPRAVADLVAHCRALYRRKSLAKSRQTIADEESDVLPITAATKGPVRPSGAVTARALSISDLIDRAVKRNEPALAAMSRKRGRALLKGAFTEIIEQLEPLSHDAAVRVAGLGEFRAAAVQSTSDAKQKLNSILFVPELATVAIDDGERSGMSQKQWIAVARKLDRLARRGTDMASAQTYCELAKAYRMANMPAEALAATARGLERYSDHVALMNEAVLAAIAARDWGHAGEIGQSLTARRTGSLDVRLGLCVAHQMVGEYEFSDKQLDWCLKTHAAELARAYPSSHVKTILFDNGETRIEFYKKLKQTNSLFVTFDPQGKEYLGNKPSFAYDFLKKLEVDIVAVRFRKERSFLQDLSVEDFTAVVGSMMGCYERKMAYGSSIGGYGALYFGTAIGCDILAMAPRNSNHPVYGGPRTPKKFRFNHDLEIPLNDSPNVTILFDPNEKMDRKYVDLGLKPRIPNAQFLEFPYAGHYIAKFLLSTGILKQLVLDAFIREVKQKYPRKNRQKAPHYLANLGIACLKRGKPKWASGLFQSVASNFPHNIKAAKRIKDAVRESRCQV